jgi:hypothetical protein
MGYVHNAERSNSLGFDANTPLTNPFAHQQHIPAAPHQVCMELEINAPFSKWHGSLSP